jgi:hypothetical protein
VADQAADRRRISVARRSSHGLSRGALKHSKEVNMHQNENNEASF